MRTRVAPLRWCTLVCLVLAGWAPAQARDSMWTIQQDNAVWRNECGACHMAFPAAMLPAGDWLTLLDALDTHYGVNASLDPATRNEIANYLDHNGVGRQSAPDAGSLPRITATDWFLQKHRGAMRLLGKAKVRTLSDCVACHTGH